VVLHANDSGKVRDLAHPTKIKKSTINNQQSTIKKPSIFNLQSTIFNQQSKNQQSKNQQSKNQQSKNQQSKI
jgi:hypothetical protein